MMAEYFPVLLAIVAVRGVGLVVSALCWHPYQRRSLSATTMTRILIALLLFAVISTPTATATATPTSTPTVTPTPTATFLWILAGTPRVQAPVATISVARPVATISVIPLP